MKISTRLLIVFFVGFATFTFPSKILANVTSTSVAVPAGNLQQGVNSQVVYIFQVNVTGTPATVNSLQVTLTGTHDANDLDIVGLWFNATNPTIAGASNITNLTGTFAAPHTYTFNNTRTFAAGTSGYYIITVSVANAGTHNNTIKLNGATNPVVLGFSAAQTYTNSQTDAAGVQTIQAADVTVSSSAVPATSIQQGSNNQPVYIAQLAVSTQPVTVNSVAVTLSGTHDANDLDIVGLWFNATNPTIAGASNITNLVGTFASPHTYTFNNTRAFAAGTSGYYIITVNVDNTGTHNNTIKVNGATNPVVIGFTTAPNYTNTQTDAAGIQTIQAADVTVSSSAVPATSIQQGSNNQPVYIAQLAVSTQPVTVNSVAVTLSGTHDANDLDIVGLWFNATNPTIAGASNITNLVGTFASPHTYTFNNTRAFAAGTSGYYIITVNVDNAGTHNNTIKVNGATSPVVIGFVTNPNYTNTQTDAAGIQTIQAADVTVSSSAVPAAVIQQGSNNQPVYIAQLAVSTQPVTVNSVAVTLSGTHDANDLDIVGLWFNATNPTIAGASNITNLVGTFASPHTYTFNNTRAFAAGTSGYYIITVNINNAGTHNNTIKVNGAASPVVIGFVTDPNYTNTQTDAAGIQTIQAADVTVSSTAVPAASIQQGSNNQPVYITQLAVNTQPVTVNSIEVTLGGTHDANDLEIVGLWFNATNPTIAGASNVTNLVGNFAAPHTYTFNNTRTFAAGTSGYYIITVNVDNLGTHNNTIKVNGAANPVVVGFVTEPNYTNTQTDIAGIQTIQASDVNSTTIPVAGAIITRGENNRVVYIAQINVGTQPVTVNTLAATLTGTHDADDLNTIGVWFNPTNPTLTGASNLSNLVATFAAPHTYNFSTNRTLAAGTTGYYLITVSASNTATLGNTVQIDGAANPLVFGFTSAPNYVNGQTNGAGTFVLPVKLTSFKAKQEDSKVAVQWTTSFEFNNAYFEVQHSTDGVHFEALGKVNSRGNTNTGNVYSFTHRLPAGGNNFYRLKQVDIDNKATFSETVLIVVKYKSDIVGLVSPNPVTHDIRFTFVAKENKKVMMLVTDQLGRTILNNTQQVIQGTNNIVLDATRLSTGSYFIQVTDPSAGIISTQKIIVQHGQ